MEVTDGQLLNQFLTQNRQEAFQELLKRHGPMVMGVCRRLLGNAHDAEDAFQATFLILSQKADSIKKWETLAGWLYRVAFRNAWRLKMKSVERRKTETPMDEEFIPVSQDATQFRIWEELRPVLDEELNRLAEKYRLPIVLCYIEGKSYHETARDLGLSHAATKIRLERARNLLRNRLVRRGVTISGGVLGGILSQNATAAVASSLTSSTVHVAVQVSKSGALFASGVPERTLALAKGTLKAMFLQKVSIAILTVAMGIGAAVGGTFVVQEIQQPKLARAIMACFMKPEISAWMVYWDNGASLKAFEEHAAMLSRVYPVWYVCDSDGLPRHDPLVSSAKRTQTLAIARQHGVKVLGMVYGFELRNIRKFLHDPSRMRVHVQELIRLAKEDGIEGLEIDYENLEGIDREPFSRFIETLASRCKREGLLLGVAVNPKTSEPGLWGSSLAQDYARLGAIVDFVQVECYGYHGSLSPAGPLAPPDWVQRIVAFASSVIPSHKLELAIPGFGYEWTEENERKVSPKNWMEWQDLVQNHGPSHRDSKTQELTLSYGNHTVWYHDASSSLTKLKIAQKFGVRSVALWSLGQEDPSLWEVFHPFIRSSRP